jgi:YVTN family beta-propeller protein
MSARQFTKEDPVMRRRYLFSCTWIVLLSLGAGPALGADEGETLKVGRQPDGRVVVPTNQILEPAGKQVTFPGRPVDMALAEDGATLVVKNMRDLVFIDVAAARIRQTLDLAKDNQPGITLNEVLKKPIGDDGKPHPPYPAGFSVVGLVVQGDRVYASDSQDQVRVARRRADGRYRWEPGLEVFPPKGGGLADPAGLARPSARELWVTSTRGNNVQLLDLVTGLAVQAVPVGVAPYGVCCPRPDRCYVSNWGGDPPGRDDSQALSSGTPVRTDDRGIADRGTVSVLGPEPGRWRQLKTIPVGLHPSGLAVSPRGRFVYVANANSDSVSVIDTRGDEVVETVRCRPEARLPFGSGANAVAVSPDGGTLYVAEGTNNCVAVVRLGSRSAEGDAAGRPAESIVAGLIPVGWYPGAVVLSADGKKLFVANVKGVGSLSQPRPVAEGKNTHDFLGSVSVIDVPDAGQLARHTETVNANNRLAYSLAGLEKPRPDARPRPVPLRHGEPSVIKHVVYVIKENRSYDQILGDIKEGDGDPNLVVFGEEVTPNQHALARQFTLFDNFYCSGALSATGHQWVNEAYVVDYLEKTFGGFTRSYPCDGDDPLAFASSGFLWDNALEHKKTFRNYGEFTHTRYTPADATWAQVYDDYRAGTAKVKIAVRPNVEPLRPYTHAHYPGFPLITPDVYRARLFLDDLKAREKEGLADLVYVYLPCNHTVGTLPGFPTPKAMVADNDLALGRVVEGISRSKFWPETCIFVIEDDPQFGFDHVDGHRTVALAISPYTKRHFVDHTNYNQTGMVKTIELVLGLPPMNQFDLSATAMRSCFQAEPDLTPYTSVPNKVLLDEMNPPLGKLRGKALYWAKKSLKQDFGREDEADEDTLNRIIWHATRGYDTPYPERFAGGRGNDADDGDRE